MKWPRTLGNFRCARVFREGAENRSRGGCAPFSHSEFGLKNGFGRAVSRILSAPCGGENHLSERPIPETCPAFTGTRSEPLLGFLFGLAPDGVFRAALLALRAVRSYRTFSPLPPQTDGGGLIFCGTFRRRTFRFTARVYPGRTGPGYVASRPMVFGLSSPGSRRERFSALPKPTLP